VRWADATPSTSNDVLSLVLDLEAQHIPRPRAAIIAEHADADRRLPEWLKSDTTISLQGATVGSSGRLCRVRRLLEVRSGG
jgi:hypothetical protein